MGRRATSHFRFRPSARLSWAAPTTYMTPDSGTIDATPNLADPAIEPSQRLSTLTSTEWATLCQWTADLIPLDRYYCDSSDVNHGDVMCEGCVLIDRSVEACLDRSTDWQSRVADCPPTVADWVECTRDRLYAPFDCVASGPESCLPELIHPTCPGR